MLMASKLHQLAFRHLVREAAPGDLVESVFAAIREAGSQEQEIQLLRILVPPTTDADGIYLVGSVLGPPNWHYHCEPLLTRHGLRCQLYA